MSAPSRPYAGQTWSRGILDADGTLLPGAALQIIGRDLAADAKLHGIDRGPVELWEHPDGTKGFFAGDTTSLIGEGWTKLAEL
jgi:hypothetical protein